MLRVSTAIRYEVGGFALVASLWVLWALSIGAQAGCEASHDGFVAPGDEFSTTDLQFIRDGLGVLSTRPPPSPSNRHADDPAAAALGQKLFFDPRYSGDGETACATCHQPENGFQDSRANLSQGVGGISRRHASTLINVAFGTGKRDPITGEGDRTVWQLWDGRADALWSQALLPPEDAIEMAGTRTRVALLIYDRYRAEYEALFGSMPALRNRQGDPIAPDTAMPGTPEWAALSTQQQDDITGVYVNFGKAVAAYQRRLVSTNSRFDEYYRAIVLGRTDSETLDARERLGLKLFVGKGRCIFCHSGPNFTSMAFWNIAVAQQGPDIPTEDRGREGGLITVRDGEFNCTSRWSDIDDPQRCGVLDLEASQRDLGAFKTPGLRSVATSAPYMHTGTFATLDDVIEHYDEGGAKDGFVGMPESNIRRLDLSPDEKAALNAFLHTLDGEPIDPALTRAPDLPE